MNSDASRTGKAQGESADWGAETERLHQIKVGLAMTPVERLQWLETTLEELRPWVGLARKEPSVDKKRD